MCDVCADEFGDRRVPYLTQSRHLDLRCVRGMAMAGLVEFEIILYVQALEKISLFEGKTAFFEFSGFYYIIRDGSSTILEDEIY